MAAGGDGMAPEEMTKDGTADDEADDKSMGPIVESSPEEMRGGSGAAMPAAGGPCGMGGQRVCTGDELSARGAFLWPCRFPWG